MDRPPDDGERGGSDRIPQIRPTQDPPDSPQVPEPAAGRPVEVEDEDEPDLNQDFLSFTPRAFELHFGDGGEVIDLLRRLVGLPPRGMQKALAQALRTLRPVPVGEIPPDERQCNVCYEEFEEPPAAALEGFLAAKTVAAESGARRDTPAPEAPPREAAAEAAAEAPARDAAAENEWYAHPENDADHYALEMPCGHRFGRGCLVAWLETSPTCPLCRTPLETGYEALWEDEEVPERHERMDYERLRPPHIWVRTDTAGGVGEDQPPPMIVHFYPSGRPTYDRPSPQSLRRFQRMVMQRAVSEAFGQSLPGSAMRDDGFASPGVTPGVTPTGAAEPMEPVAEAVPPAPPQFYGPERPPSMESSPTAASPASAVPSPGLEPAAAVENRPTWRLALDRGLVGFYTFYQQHRLGRALGAAATDAAPSPASSAGNESDASTPQSETSTRRGPQRHNLRRNHPYQ